MSLPAEALPKHPPHPFFGVADDCLTISGRKLTDIAAEVGQTPFYVYAREYMTARAEHLRRALPRGVHLHYAMKANPMPQVVKHMAGLVDGLDVASAREMQVALATGTAPAFSARAALAALRPASEVMTVAPRSRRRRAVAEPISPIAMTPIVVIGLSLFFNVVFA